MSNNATPEHLKMKAMQLDFRANAPYEQFLNLNLSLNEVKIVNIRFDSEYIYIIDNESRVEIKVRKQ